MTGDTNKTRPAFCLRVQTPIPAPPTGLGETLANLTLPKSERRSVGGPRIPGDRGVCPVAPRARPPALSHHTRPASPALPSARGSSPGTPQHLRERYLSPARQPSLRSGAHGSVSFPCFSSSSLSPPGPSPCRLSRRRLTNPGVPAARARSGPSLSLTGGKQLRGQGRRWEAVRAPAPGYQQPEVKPREQGEREGAQKTESEN